ncbi:polyprenyl diphosphate synthase [Sulfuricurvum sp.]|uniref:polyprenyl diphosphate synthase n=1 Tax=Sulfuricurvum sp. TaxID=2025608 RepID=UPI00199DB50D|nr:polyprenyl diphosphate synthase [Sulfuricurvum sp.]MBD3798997.1 di-trans,poly-cis-decaprenylcistransferase [Campylobacterota bacterium]MBD3806396.1 di-trans,poly-cis-decaprenylcistransferase [Sulfuricurvum sp.]
MSNRPNHIAIIMDGNGRWAKERNMNRTAGHERGAEVVRTITSFCSIHPEIERLTLYAFSTENWKRPKLEVEFLMKLLEKYLKNEQKNYLEENVRFEPIGDLSIFSKSLRKVIDDLQSVTQGCNGLVQSLALNYGGRDEIVRAVNNLFPSTPITVEQLSNALDCKHDIDLLIRTGGDHRLSNFLLWQAAYAELFFTNTLWPEFTSVELESIIKKFKTVERRFGGLN